MTDTLDSYVCGTADAPLLGDTIGRCLDQAAARWGDREALVSPSHDVRWTWKEFAGASTRWRRAFSRLAWSAARGSGCGRSTARNGR